MRSIGAVLERLTNRIESEAGYSHTTYNKTNPFARASRSEAEAQMQVYGAVSTLFIVVSKIANSCGSVDWRLYRKKSDQRRVYGPQADDDTEITKHVALDIWQKPNPFYSQSTFVEAAQQHIDLTGESFWVIAKNPMSPMPLELWIVRPDRMEVIPSLEEYIQGYIYKGPNGEQIPLARDQVVHAKMPNPLDPYRGLGPVQTLMVDLQAHKAAGEFNRNFFRNDATPGGVIEMDTRLSDSEWVEFNERWRHSHQGVSNAHRVAMIENGGKWKDVGFTHRDMQFAELRRASTDMILEAFGMSPHMIGREETVNRATAEAAEDVFARWVLVPRLDRIKDALNNQLLPLFQTSGQGMEFDFDDPSLESSEANDNSMKAKAEAAATLIAAGGEFASVLEAVGLPEIEFDQAKVDREEQAKQDSLAALQAGQSANGQGPSKNGSAPEKKEAVPAS